MERHVVDAKGCWIWTGHLGEDGYGQIGVGRKATFRAHRVSYEAFVGPIPDGLWVLHKCDVPACINPGHLFVGTPKDNVADCWAKGRHRVVPFGAGHPMSKITDLDVWKIRRMRHIGMAYSTIAPYFGLVFQNVHRICKGAAWKHVDMEAMRLKFMATNPWVRP